MKSREGTTVKNPTVAQRKTILLVAESLGIEVYANNGFSEISEYPWVWFSGENNISRCTPLVASETFVSFKKFIEVMYQEKEKVVVTIDGNDYTESELRTIISNN